MGIKLYNSLTRKKEDFVPIKPPEVKMYVCGPTVYDFLHVGNFRGPVVCNLVRNWLEYRGYKVTYAMNFTDVDDKIIARARENNEDPQALAQRFVEEYKKDYASLGLRPHDLNPKVTESMDSIVEMIAKLIDSKKAYVSGSDVMYSIEAFPEYGKLSGRHIEDLQAGVRIEVDEKKKNPLDFALWKGAKPGEPSWNSPWGPGRPGWHIECSAMICRHLGEQIDIHGGGLDLLFPHHENEIAQTEGVTNKNFVRYWMHWNLLNFDGQKMSKSLGNFQTLRQFLSHSNAEIYKWMMLSSHYRSVCEFSQESVDRAVSGLARVYSALCTAEEMLDGMTDVKPDANFEKLTNEAWQKVEVSLDDDFNTPEAFAAMYEVIRVFNSQVKRGMKANPTLAGKAKAFVNFIHRLGQPMALFQEKGSAFLRTLDDMLLGKMNLKREEIDKIVADRSQARSQKDFKKSDELRDQLAKMGISVMDSPTGSVWEVTK